MIVKIFSTAVIPISFVSWLAQAAPPTDATWVLLGLDIHMGAVTVRDTAADTVSVYGEGLPVYQTSAACQAALRATQSRNTQGGRMRKGTTVGFPAWTGGPGRRRPDDRGGSDDLLTPGQAGEICDASSVIDAPLCASVYLEG